MNVILVLRRTDNAVDSRLEVPSRPKVQRVANITDDATIDRRDVLPVAAGGLQLQAGNGLVPEQRQGPKVRVCTRPAVVDLSVVLLTARTIHHVSEVVIASLIVPVSGREVVLWKFKNYRAEFKDLAGNSESALENENQCMLFKK